MSNSANTGPSIEITIEGIIALLFERDAQQQIVACVAGVVRNVPQHKFTVTVTKFDAQGNPTRFDFEPADGEDVSLHVSGTTETGIRLAGEGEEVDRVCGDGDQQTFSWVLDLDALHERPIGVDPAKFRSRFRINTGELHTVTISENHLLTQPEGSSNEPYTLVGKVATIVGLRQNLDTEESEARLTVGAADPIVVRTGERLAAKVKHICPTEEQRVFGQQSGHGNHYYKALGKHLEWGEKKLFSSTRFESGGTGGTSGPISPEASCLVGSAGSSNPNG